jgi:hypothetical protein
LNLLNASVVETYVKCGNDKGDAEQNDVSIGEDALEFVDIFFGETHLTQGEHGSAKLHPKA